MLNGRGPVEPVGPPRVTLGVCVSLNPLRQQVQGRQFEELLRRVRVDEKRLNLLAQCLVVSAGRRDIGGSQRGGALERGLVDRSTEARFTKVILRPAEGAHTGFLFACTSWHNPVLVSSCGPHISAGRGRAMPESRRESRKAVGLSLRAIVRALWCRVSCVLGIAFAMPSYATEWWPFVGWRMGGHDIFDTRSQPFEFRISPRNVARLAPKWVLTTAGDVSATPAVVTEAAGHGDTTAATWSSFPIGEASSGRSMGRQARSCGRARSRNTTASRDRSRARVLSYARGMIFVGDLNGNMMAVDAATGDLVWLTELDPNPNTIVTTSPIVFGNRLYIATSSSGGGAGSSDISRQPERARRAHRSDHLAVLRPPGQRRHSGRLRRRGVRQSSGHRPGTWPDLRGLRSALYRSQPRSRRVSRRRPVAGASRVFPKTRASTR